MQLYLTLAVILLTQGIHCCSRIAAAQAFGAVAQSKKQNSKQREWKEILAMTNRAYAAYKQEKEVESQKLFAEAAAKMEDYIKKHETSQTNLRYLRLLVRLGALYQNADRLDQARIVFEQCERHQEFNATSATIRVSRDGKQVEESIANYVKAQLCFLTDCPPIYKEAAKTLRKLTIDSRGTELAPLILDIKP